MTQRGSSSQVFGNAARACAVNPAATTPKGVALRAAAGHIARVNGDILNLDIGYPDPG